MEFALPQKSYNSWSQLPLAQKLQIVDIWTLVIIASNFFHMVGLIFILFPNIKALQYYEDLLLGLGTFLIIVSLQKYIQHYDDINVLPATGMIAFKPLVLQTISTIPIIVGLAYFLLSYFGYSWRFNSLYHSIIMLFAIM